MVSSQDESKRKHIGIKRSSSNKAYQSLCISTKETTLKRPFAEHHIEAKKATLSQLLPKEEEILLQILAFLSSQRPE